MTGGHASRADAEAAVSQRTLFWRRSWPARVTRVNAEFLKWVTAASLHQPGGSGSRNERECLPGEGLKGQAGKQGARASRGLFRQDWGPSVFDEGIGERTPKCPSNQENQDCDATPGVRAAASLQPDTCRCHGVQQTRLTRYLGTKVGILPHGASRPVST